ncbi:TPA: EscU/YscU/HrcU family type III secretion system export apparatus switch protein, partial [Proteus mirabilis]
MAEKTEKPTQKKLDDSAKKGQSFKSKELVSGLVYFIGVIYLFNQVKLDEFN